MKSVIEGAFIRTGDNIDTDQIYPGRYLAITDPEEIAKHCMEGVDPAIAANFPAGGIVVAGRNFGCGSSREHAPIALIHMGAAAVVAESFARIFFRNAINLGLPLFICPGISKVEAEKGSIRIEPDEGRVSIEGEELACEPLSEHVRNILAAGGIKPMMRKRFAKE